MKTLRGISLRIGRSAWGMGLALIFAFGSAQPEAAEPASPARKPQRIVSLNLCADQILLDLVDRSRLAAVTYLATDPRISAVHREVAGLATTRGGAEEVLALEPDLVIGGTMSTPATVNLLERVGLPVIRLGFANSLDEIRASVRELAHAVGEAERGEAMIRAFNRRLAVAAQQVPAGARPSALVYEINGLTEAAGTLMDGVLQAAGFTNHATVMRVTAGGSVPLEDIVARPPDLMVVAGGDDEYRTAVADTLRHPALRTVIAARQKVIVPSRLWLCGTPHVAGAIETLATARKSVVRHEAAP